MARDKDSCLAAEREHDQVQRSLVSDMVCRVLSKTPHVRFGHAVMEKVEIGICSNSAFPQNVAALSNQ